MARLVHICILAALALASVGAGACVEARGNTPLAFTRNSGQVDAAVCYMIRGPQGSAFFTRHGVTFDLCSKRPPADDRTGRGAVLRVQFVSPDPGASIEPINELPGKVNYLRGDRSKWITDVPTFAGIAYRDVWPGVDVIYTGDGSSLKYDVCLRPGAELGRVRFTYEGAEELRLDTSGRLYVRTAVATFVEDIPGVYQEKCGRRVWLRGGYVLAGEREIGFRVDDYDPSFPLVIDPTSDLLWGTFLGGVHLDRARGLALDSSNQVFVAGTTRCGDYPVSAGAYDTALNGACDAFVTKLSADGSTMIYSTYLGGSSSDGANCIDVNPFTGVAYVGGYTQSTDFPVAALHFDDTLNGDMDGFVAAINSTGTALIYSSYLGGSEGDAVYAGTLDPSDRFYVAGETTSAELYPAAGGYCKTSRGASDGFVAKVSQYGSVLSMCTYLGGTGEDEIHDIALGPSAGIYVSGYTSGGGFPTTTGAFDQTYNGNGDGFVSQLDSTGETLQFSTFLGGDEDEATTSIEVDSSGYVYVGGWTASPDFPSTPDAFDPEHYGGYSYPYDGVVTKLAPGGASLIYSTFIGSYGNEDVLDIAIDAAGCVYATGSTESTYFPVTVGAFDTSYNGSDGYTDDAFVLKLNEQGSDLIYSSYLGGRYAEYGRAIAVDGSGGVYLCGDTTSPDFPSTPGSFDPDYNGPATMYEEDAWVIKFRTPDVVPPVGSVVINDDGLYTESTSVTLTITAKDNSAETPQMRLSSNNTFWTSWQNLTSPYGWTIGSSDGLKTVYVQFRDGEGNVSQSYTDTIYLDTAPPFGGVSINGGVATTNTTSVTLDLTAADLGTGVADMRFSAPGTAWTAWEPFAASRGWTLASGDGTKTVYVQYRDVAGHMSGSYSDTIELDTQAPTGSVTIDGGAQWAGSISVALGLSASDAGSGVSLVRVSNDGVTWSPWQAYSTPKPWSLAEGDGAKTVYVKYSDWAGNTSDVYTDGIVLDTQPPTGGVVINNDDAYTTSPFVELSLSAADSGMGVTEMRFANQKQDFGPWEPYAQTKQWTLPLEQGSLTVSVQFRDGAGRESEVCVDDIVVDSVAPDGGVLINDGSTYTNSTTVTLTLSAEDSGSGVTGMRFSSDGTTWTKWGSYSPTSSWKLSTGDGEKQVHVQYRDAAGMVSKSYFDTIVLDTSLPVGSVTVDSGATYANSTDVALALTASDTGSGVSSMRFSNNGLTWGKWDTYSATAAWSLSVGDGTKTVYAQFRDAAGNTSPSCTDSIVLDSTAPIGTVVIHGDAAYTTATSVLLAISASDGGSGVEQMRLSNDGTAWTSWQSYAVSKSWTLVAGDGVKSVYVQFKDYAGNESESFVDVIVLGTPVPLAHAKSLPVGQVVILAGVPVTAKFADRVYLEAADRTCGIAALGDPLTAPGDAVDVAGVLTASDDEKAIDLLTFAVTGVGHAPPLGMAVRGVGGGDWLYSPSTGAGQRGVTGGQGLNNIGLLVRTCGSVVGRDPSSPARWFAIDDGSGRNAKCVVPSGVAVDPDWVYVRVTGVSSCERVGTELHRLIRVREQADVTPF